MADMKLQECPWCGQEPEILFDAVEGDTHGTFLIHHRVDKCGVHRFGFYRYATKEEAIKHWNTRATDSTIEAQEAEIKRLRPMLKEVYILGFCQSAEGFNAEYPCMGEAELWESIGNEFEEFLKEKAVLKRE